MTANKHTCVDGLSFPPVDSDMQSKAPVFPQKVNLSTTSSAN